MFSPFAAFLQLLIGSICLFVLIKYWKRLDVFVKTSLIIGAVAYGIPSLGAMIARF